MEKTMFVSDDCEKRFTNRSEMSDFIGEREANTVWLVEPVTSLRYEGLLDEPLMAPIYSEKMNVSDEAIIDTMTGSNLLLKTSVGEKPVGISAILSITDRAGWKADGYKKMRNYNPLKLAEALNLFIEASSGNVHVKLADEKVRAVHSSSYTFISGKVLLDTVLGYFDKNWPEFTFENGYFSHEFIRAELNLSAYHDMFMAKIPGSLSSNLLSTSEPAFIMTSSDIATSAVHLRPALALKSGIYIPLGNSIEVEHTGDDIEGRVVSELNMLLAYFQERTEDLQNLEKIRVVNARNALKRFLKKIKFPKKCGLEAVESFETMFGDEPATALDLYFAVVDAYSSAVRAFGDNEKKLLIAAESVVSASHVRWSDYDLPGEVDY